MKIPIVAHYFFINDLNCWHFIFKETALQFINRHLNNKTNNLNCAYLEQEH